MSERHEPSELGKLPPLPDGYEYSGEDIPGIVRIPASRQRNRNNFVSRNPVYIAQLYKDIEHKTYIEMKYFDRPDKWRTMILPIAKFLQSPRTISAYLHIWPSYWPAFAQALLCMHEQESRNKGRSPKPLPSDAVISRPY
jgi:hypothetical protein